MGRGNSDILDWGRVETDDDLTKGCQLFIASISLPSGNSGNGIKSWCEAWPQGQTRLQSGRTFNLLRDHTLLL